jgi:hypothetical protein
MKKVWLCFLPVFLLGLSYCSINVRGTDLEPQESCAAEPVFLDEDGFIVPLPAESVTWPSGADPTFVDIEGFVDQNAIVSGSRSSDIYISPGDDEQHTLNLYSASSGGLTSQTEMRWEPSSGNFASIAIVEPGAAFPFGFEVLGFANHCNCSNDNEDYSARLVMKPAPDLYDGQEYVLVTIVNNGVVTHQSFSRASYAMVAGWPWWLGGGTAPPAANPPPVGPAVPPPPAGGPAVLPLCHPVLRFLLGWVLL